LMERAALATPSEADTAASLGRWLRTGRHQVGRRCWPVWRPVRPVHLSGSCPHPRLEGAGCPGCPG
jgi:hypothetical protein